MNLSLGNMLGKRMAINPDGLSLDLAFAADKTLTARKGPTPTFTRASTATFVGSNGLIQSAAINEARFDHDPVTLACKGLLIEEARTNALLNSNALSTQNVTVTATARTVSFYGSGTVVLSGTHVATVVGTGAYPARTTLTFTPSAGTLTLTVTGTVEFAQLEAGAFPTSYIPTTTAALTRSADVCSITGGNFTSFYNQSEGTVVTGYSSFANSQVLPSKRGITMSDGTTANRVAFANIPDGFTFPGGSMVFVATSGGVIVAVLGETGLDTTTLNIMSGAYKVNDFASSTNGSAVVTDTSGAVPVGINKIDIGNQLSTEFINGHIARIQYFRKRLPNAKLQTLTT